MKTQRNFAAQYVPNPSLAENILWITRSGILAYHLTSAKYARKSTLVWSTWLTTWEVTQRIFPSNANSKIVPRILLEKKIFEITFYGILAKLITAVISVWKLSPGKIIYWITLDSIQMNRLIFVVFVIRWEFI